MFLVEWTILKERRQRKGGTRRKRRRRKGKYARSKNNEEPKKKRNSPSCYSSRNKSKVVRNASTEPQVVFYYESAIIPEREETEGRLFCLLINNETLGLFNDDRGFVSKVYLKIERHTYFLDPNILSRNILPTQVRSYHIFMLFLSMYLSHKSYRSLIISRVYENRFSEYYE